MLNPAKRGLIVGLALIVLGLMVTGASAASFRAGQEAVATGATNAIGNKANRVGLRIRNQDGTNPVYCSGASDVSSSTGFRVAAGQDLPIVEIVDGQPMANVELYCIATGAEVTVSFIEYVR